jgi:type III secretion protein W
MKVDSSLDVQQPLALDQLAPARIDSGQMPQKTIAPAADDLGVLFSQEVGLNSMALGRRPLGVRISPVQQLSQLYEQLGHPAQATLESVARKVRLQLLQGPSVGSLLELTGNDPARAYVVLKHVSAQAQAEARSAEATLARDALAKLEIRFKPQIQAGLNIAMALQADTDDPQLRQAARSLYYASVVSRQSLATMMQALLGLFGSEEFSAGLKLMRRALADDIAAHTPSVACAKLRTLLLGLQSCGQLGGVLAHCQGLIERLASLHPGLDQNAVALLQRLLGYASTGIAPTEVQRLGSEFGGAEPAGQLVSLNAIYPVLQRLPLALWRDSKGRQETLEDFLMVMDVFASQERGGQHPVTWRGIEA